MIATDNTVSPEQSQEAIRNLANVLAPHMPSNLDEDKARAMIDNAIASARLPRPIEVHMPDGTVNTLSERTHRQFEEVMGLVEEGHNNIMLVGPAGTGKTTLAKHVAKALGRTFNFISLSAGVTETHIFGRMLPQADGTWAYVESPFVRIYRNGGVYLFDEVDAADGNVMVSINAALANGMMCNPVNGEMVERHPDCIIITAANTFGRGGDFVYVGRNALDGATLDRFVLTTLTITYDVAMEKDMALASLEDAKAHELVGWVNDLRDKLASSGLRRIASMRLVIQGIMAMKAGRTLEQVKARYFQSWSRDEKAQVGEV